jgi:hypothetical protein
VERGRSYASAALKRRDCADSGKQPKRLAKVLSTLNAAFCGEGGCCEHYGGRAASYRSPARQRRDQQRSIPLSLSSAGAALPARRPLRNPGNRSRLILSLALAAAADYRMRVDMVCQAH